MANEANAGKDKGNTKRIKTVKWEAPSINADSNISRGKVLM